VSVVCCADWGGALLHVLPQLQPRVDICVVIRGLARFGGFVSHARVVLNLFSLFQGK
jgi:hypothetical protein